MEQDKPLTVDQLPGWDNEVRRLLQAGQLAEANVLFDQAVAHPPTAERTVRASLLVSRAVIAWRLGRIPLALELAAEGWTDLGTGTEGPAAAWAFGQLGYLLEGIGNRRAALDTLRLSVRLARDAGDPTILATNLQRLGGTLNFRATEAPPEQALPAYEEARSVLAEGLALTNIAPYLRRALLGAYGRSLAGLGELAAAAEAGRQVLRTA
ncbi:MAG TPA: tetratricopeptide repeat protein, partial [Pseudonocardiaceae bacterium]